MKNIILAVALSVQAFNIFAQTAVKSDLDKLIAQQYPEYPKVMLSAVTIEPYAAARKPGGEYVKADEWHGWVIIAKPDESKCLKVVRENFRVKQFNGLQQPSFEGSVIGVDCPKTVSAPNNP